MWADTRAVREVVVQSWMYSLSNFTPQNYQPVSRQSTCICLVTYILVPL